MWFLRLRGPAALSLLFGVLGSAQAQERSGPCPGSTAISGTITEQGPARAVACAFDGRGNVRAAIVEGGAHPLPRVVVYGDGVPYQSASGLGVKIIDLDPGPVPRSFEQLSPSVRQRIADLFDGPSSPPKLVPAGRTGVAAVAPRVPSDPAILARYEYDPLGRVRKKIGEEGIRQYVYDGDSNRVLAEYDLDGNLVASYSWAGDRLNGITRAGVGTVHPTFDGLGSVAALTDSQGEVVARNQYDAWGNFRLRQESFPYLNSFGFTGHRWEPNTGLYNANARYFDPQLGRFTTQDTYLGEVADPASLHRYLYANTNPARYVDPTGHQSIGAEFCRAYKCSVATRRQVDPLYAAEKKFEEAVNTVGGAGVDVAVQLFEETLGNAGHRTPEAQARRNRALPRPENTVEAVLATGGYFAVVVSPVASRMLRETPVEVGPVMAHRPGTSVAQSEAAALRGAPDGIVAESSAQISQPAPAEGHALLDPREINYSQRSVGGNVEAYARDMASGKWDWAKSGPVRVMKTETGYVSFDNRRVMAAQDAELERIPTMIVRPDLVREGSKRTWEEAFALRFNDPRNIEAGGPVPPTGLKERPLVVDKKPR